MHAGPSSSLPSLNDLPAADRLLLGGAAYKPHQMAAARAAAAAAVAASAGFPLLSGYNAASLAHAGLPVRGLMGKLPGAGLLAAPDQGYLHPLAAQLGMYGLNQQGPSADPVTAAVLSQLSNAAALHAAGLNAHDPATVAALNPNLALQLAVAGAGAMPLDAAMAMALLAAQNAAHGGHHPVSASMGHGGGSDTPAGAEAASHQHDDEAGNVHFSRGVNTAGLSALPAAEAAAAAASASDKAATSKAMARVPHSNAMGSQPMLTYAIEGFPHAMDIQQALKDAVASINAHDISRAGGIASSMGPALAWPPPAALQGAAGALGTGFAVPAHAAAALGAQAKQMPLLGAQLARLPHQPGLTDALALLQANQMTGIPLHPSLLQVSSSQVLAGADVLPPQMLGIAVRPNLAAAGAPAWAGGQLNVPLELLQQLDANAARLAALQQLHQAQQPPKEGPAGSK